MDFKKILLGLGALIVVVACSAGVSVAAMMYVMEQQKAMTEEEVAAEESEDPALYISLEPIVVNYTQGTALRYLQLSVELMTRQEETIETINAEMPEIRNALILQLSGQTYEMLVTREGKEHMRDRILEEVNLLLGEEDETVESVLLTSFVMQ